METASQTRAGLDAGAAARTKRILGEPFLATTWRRVAYQLIAPVLGFVSVPMALLGGPAGAVQCAAARRLLGVTAEGTDMPRRRVLAHAVLSTPLNIVVFAVTVYGWSLVPMNLGYPLRAGDPTGAWGGPTLAGAWALHAVCGGVTFLFLMPWIGRGLGALQVRLLTALYGRRRVDGSRRPSPSRSRPSPLPPFPYR